MLYNSSHSCHPRADQAQTALSLTFLPLASEKNTKTLSERSEFGKVDSTLLHLWCLVIGRVQNASDVCSKLFIYQTQSSF